MTQMRARKRATVLVMAFLVAATVLGVLMFQKYRGSRELPQVAPQPQEAGSMQVTLFFAAPGGEGLVREGREVDACEDLADCVESVVDELINGPIGDLGPTLPPNAVVRGVRIEGDTAVVDFGKELVEGLPGGSSSETTAAYSVVDTVCLNFPRLKRVKFLIDGQEAQTLKGHLDLRQPIAPDFPEKAPVPDNKM